MNPEANLEVDRGNVSEQVEGEWLSKGKGKVVEKPIIATADSIFLACVGLKYDGTEDTERALRIQLSDRLSKPSQVNSAIKFLKQKYTAELHKDGPGETSLLAPLTAKIIASKFPTPPQIPSIPEEEIVEGQVVTSDSDSLNVSAKETQRVLSDESQQFHYADTQVNQSISVDKSLSVNIPVNVEKH